MKNYLIICGLLLISTIGNTFGACSDAPRPYVDWRGCDKRGITLEDVNAPMKTIDMEGALIDGADFSGATINAYFYDLDLPINNVKFENVNFVSGSTIYSSVSISNLSFKNSKGSLSIQAPKINNLNFDNFIFQTLQLISSNGVINNVSLKNMTQLLQYASFSINSRVAANIDFSDSDFSMRNGIGEHRHFNFTEFENINFTRANLRQVMNLPEVLLNNSRINYTDTDFQLAKFGHRECQKGSIGRCWTLRDLHPIE